MRDIEVRCQNEKDEIRSEAKRDEDNYERKLKEERSRLNEVQFKLNLVQAEVDNNSKTGKRQDDEIEELEDKLRKVTNLSEILAKEILLKGKRTVCCYIRVRLS